MKQGLQKIVSLRLLWLGMLMLCRGGSEVEGGGSEVKVRAETQRRGGLRLVSKWRVTLRAANHGFDVPLREELGIR